MKTLQSISCALACLCVLSLACPAFGDDADRLFSEGRAAFNEQRYADGLRAFEQAWKIRKSYDIAGALAQTEMQLGKHRDAAEHLAFVLRTFPATGDDGLRKTLEAAFADVKKHVAAVRVVASVNGAEVRVDGVPVGHAPLADDIFVMPGTHMIEARLERHLTASKKLDAKEGTAERVELALVPESETTAAPSRLPAYVAFGAGGAGLLTGIITGAVSLAKYGDVKDACNAELVCPATLRGEADTGKALGHVSTAGFVLAGVGAAVGVTLLLVTPGKSASNAALSISPGFVGVKGAF